MQRNTCQKPKSRPENFTSFDSCKCITYENNYDELLIGSYLLAYTPDAGTAAISKREKLETGDPAAMLTTTDVRHTNNPILSSSARAAVKKTFTTTNGHVSFFARPPVSDVDARNDRVKITLDASSGELMFNIAMGDFKFQNKKMGRDARRKYIEIDNFPRATFYGVHR